jgi:lipopolysaccharide export system permease protein
MKILSRYILKEHISPFLISLLVVTFVLLIDRIMDLLNMIIEKKLAASVIVNLFLLSLPYMLALAIPMAVLVATILAFGRLTVDRETIGMKSCGINIYSMIKPLVVTAVILTGLMVYFNHWFLPNTNHKLKNLMVKVAYFRPMTIIKPGEFTTVMDYTVFVKENSGEVLKDVLIYDRSETTLPRTILAESGKVMQMDNGNSLRLFLYKGEMHERNAKEQGKYQVRRFDEFILNIRNLATNLDVAESGYRSDREMTYKQLHVAMQDKQREIDDKQKEIASLDERIAALGPETGDYARSVEFRRLTIMRTQADDRVGELNENMRSLKVEFHKKFALSFAVIIFILIGIPLGLMTRSSGIGMAFSMSAVIFLVYYVALTGGEQLADKGLMSPFLSMWISNIAFLGIGILLIYASIREKQIVNLKLLGWKLTHWKQRKQAAPDELLH